MATRSDGGSGGATYHLRHQWDGERALSDRIVSVVAGYEDADSAALPPIGASINPEALDDLFATTQATDATPGCVTFSYYGYTVVVQSTGRILLREN